MFFIPLLCLIVIVILIIVYFHLKNSNTNKKFKTGILISIGLTAMVMIIFPFVFPILGLFFLSYESAQKSKEAGCYGVEYFDNPVWMSKERAHFTGSKQHIGSRFGKKDNLIYRSAINSPDSGSYCVPIEHADPNTFKVLSSIQAIDKNNAYVQFKSSKNNVDPKEYTIFNIDSNTYELVDFEGNYTRDKNNVYYHTKIFEGVDSNSFEIINASDNKTILYTKDKNNLFLHSNITKDISGNYSSFTQNVDIETFEILNEKYFRDKNHIYNNKGNIINDADVTTFVTIGNKTCIGLDNLRNCDKYYDAKDVHHKYYQGEIVDYVDDDSSYTRKTLAKINFEKEQPFIQGYKNISPGNAHWNQEGDGYMKLITQNGESDEKGTVIVSTEMDLPLDTDSMQFRFQFMSNNEITPSVLLVYINQSNKHLNAEADYVIHSDMYNNEWNSIEWINDLHQYAGNKIDLTFKLLTKDKISVDSAIVNLDNIIFAKTVKKDDNEIDAVKDNRSKFEQESKTKTGWREFVNTDEKYSIAYPKEFSVKNDYNITNYKKDKPLYYIDSDDIEFRIQKHDLNNEPESVSDYKKRLLQLNKKNDEQLYLVNLGDFVTIAQYFKHNKGEVAIKYTAFDEVGNVYYDILIFEQGYLDEKGESLNKNLIESIIETFIIL